MSYILTCSQSTTAQQCIKGVQYLLTNVLHQSQALCTWMQRILLKHHQHVIQELIDENINVKRAPIVFILSHVCVCVLCITS
jgi:hypothetical protein